MRIVNRSAVANFWSANYLACLAGVLILAGLVASSFMNYLLFHTMAELFAVVIAGAIFVVAWNTREISDNKYLLFLGIAYLFVAMLDFTHALAYKGMNLFGQSGANLPTQLWIGARLVESVSLAISPVFFTRRLNIRATFLAYSGLCTLFLASLFVWPLFPDCFVEGIGLTPFKKASELFIILMLGVAAASLHRKRTCLEGFTFQMMLTSLVATMISETAFMYYVSVYGLSNLVGHLFKIASFYLIYRAVIVATLAMPYRTLFRKLVESQAAKAKVSDQLEASVRQVRLLQNFLPICSSCKQIRDDQGYWRQVEEYISDHSEMQFTHSICPSCTRKLYPDLQDEPV